MDETRAPSSIPSPKLGTTSTVDSWYRYYAGYSADFVDYVISQIAPRARTLLDPWNGTGTTTVLAANRRIGAIGYDVNPALVVVARARVLGASVQASLTPLCDDIVAHVTCARLRNDPLTYWFAPSAAGHVRGLQRSIHRLLVGSGRGGDPPADQVEQMSTLAAFYYAALFRTVRVLIAPCAGTNPMWWKRLDDASKLAPARRTITSTFAGAVRELSDGLHRRSFEASIDITLGLNDSRDLPLPDSSVDVVLTSPPYCTRIDYGMATLPELAVLRASDAGIRSLRDLMVGTPTMTGEAGDPASWGPAGQQFLAEVRAHPSHASGTYYTKYFHQYYAAMWQSLHELRRVTKDGAPCVLVVQDSRYKEIRNDTATILTEMAARIGFSDVDRHDFAVGRVKASMNPYVRKYRDEETRTETVLVFR